MNLFFVLTRHFFKVHLLSFILISFTCVVFGATFGNGFRVVDVSKQFKIRNRNQKRIKVRTSHLNSWTSWMAWWFWPRALQTALLLRLDKSQRVRIVQGYFIGWLWCRWCRCDSRANVSKNQIIVNSRECSIWSGDIELSHFRFNKCDLIGQRIKIIPKVVPVVFRFEFVLIPKNSFYCVLIDLSIVAVTN